MSRRDIRYTIRFSEYEWNQLTKDLKENSECKFRYSTKEGRLNISAYIRDKLFKKEKEEKRREEEGGRRERIKEEAASGWDAA